MARQGLENRSTRSTSFKTRFSAKFPGANELKSRVNTQVPMGCDNNNELYLHDHTNTYSIAKAMFRNQNYNIGQLRYFDNNLSRTSKQAEIYFMNYILIK